MDGPLSAEPIDPFDLPEWLGVEEVVWHADAPLGASHRVAGRLSGSSQPPGTVGIECDLVAVDEAYPRPVAGDDLRLAAHRAWRHGQVLLSLVGGRTTLVVPGSRVGVELTMAALERLARAVGADPARYAIMLRIGTGEGTLRR